MNNTEELERKKKYLKNLLEEVETWTINDWKKNKVKELILTIQENFDLINSK